MIGHDTEPETHYEFIPCIFEELSRETCFLHIIKVKEKILNMFIRFFWVNILDYKSKGLRLHEKLQSSCYSPLLICKTGLFFWRISELAFLIVNFCRLFFLSFALILVLLWLWHKIWALNVKLRYWNLLLTAILILAHICLCWYKARGNISLCEGLGDQWAIKWILPWYLCELRFLRPHHLSPLELSDSVLVRRGSLMLGDLGLLRSRLLLET